MSDTPDCTHRHGNHTDGWPAGTVGGAFVIAPSDRCTDCGHEVKEVTDDAGVTSWVTA